MEGQGNPFEEIQRLSKSALASRVKDILVDTSELVEKDDTEFSPKKKLELVRKLVENIINTVPGYPPNRAIEGLAKSVLAHQIRDTLNEEGGSDEGKVDEIRRQIEHFIVSS